MLLLSVRARACVWVCVDDCRTNTCVDMYQQRSVTSAPAMWKPHTLKKTVVGKVGNCFRPAFILKTIPIWQNLETHISLCHPFFYVSSKAIFQLLLFIAFCAFDLLGYLLIKNIKSIKNQQKQCWHWNKQRQILLLNLLLFEPQIEITFGNSGQWNQQWNDFFLSVIDPAWSNTHLTQQRRSNPSLENPTKHTHTHSHLHTH